MKKVKKNNTLKIIIAIIIFIAIPCICYIVSGKFDGKKLSSSEFAGKIGKILEVDEKVKSESLSEPNRKSQLWVQDMDSIGGEYYLGSLSEFNYDWREPYLLSETMGIYDSAHIAFCCCKGWPLIKIADGDISNDDDLGTTHTYGVDGYHKRLANRNGHLAGIEYQFDFSQSDVWRGIPYLEWQGFSSSYMFQNIVWSEWQWESFLTNGNYPLEPEHEKSVSYKCDYSIDIPTEPTEFDAYKTYSATSALSYGDASKNSAIDQINGFLLIGTGGSAGGTVHSKLDTNNDGIVSKEEQLAPYGGSVEKWRVAILASYTAQYGPYARAEQFATFQYQVLHLKGFEGVIKAQERQSEDETKNDLHVMVDQETKAEENRYPSYTVGPYMISMTEGDNTSAAQGDFKLKDLVYNEIVGGNFGQEKKNTFLSGYFEVNVKYRDGTTAKKKTTIKPKYDKNNVAENGCYQKDSMKPGEVILVDENGKALEEGFPKFDQTFYIRYYVEEGKKATFESIEPDMGFSFIGDSLKETGKKYKSKKVKYSLHYSLVAYYGNSGASSYLKSLYPNVEYDIHGLGNGFGKNNQQAGGDAYLIKATRGLDEYADIINEGENLIKQGIENSSNRSDATKTVEKVVWEESNWQSNEGGSIDTNRVYDGRLVPTDGKNIGEGRCDGIFLYNCTTSGRVDILNPYKDCYPNEKIDGEYDSENGTDFLPEFDKVKDFLSSTNNDYTIVGVSDGMRFSVHSFSQKSIDQGIPKYNSGDDLNIGVTYGDSGLYSDSGLSGDEKIDKLVEHNRVKYSNNKYCSKCYEEPVEGECKCHECTCDPCDCDDCDCDDCGCDDCDCEEKNSKPEVLCSCGTTCDMEDCGCVTLTMNEDLIFNVGMAFYRDMYTTNVSWLHDENSVHNPILKIYPDTNDRDENYDSNHSGNIANNFDTYQIKIPATTFTGTKKSVDNQLWDYIKNSLTEQIKIFLSNRQTDLKNWASANATGALYIPYTKIGDSSTEKEGNSSPYVVEDNDGMQPIELLAHFQAELTATWVDYGPEHLECKLPGKTINQYLGGNVSENAQGIKGDGSLKKTDAGAQGARHRSFTV